MQIKSNKHSLQLTHLEGTLGSESDDRGLFDIDKSIPAGPIIVWTKVRIAAEGVEPSRLSEIVTWAEAHSPVVDALRRQIVIKPKIEFDQPNISGKLPAVGGW